jgi:hypothetical protein
MSLIRFEIRYADGKKEIANVDGERALIGNGAHCDIRLPLDQAASEHVAVEVIGGTVRLETKAFDPPATINGMPFTNMPISPDVPLKIGSTRIFITIGELALDGGPVFQKKAEQTSPLMKLLAVGVLFAGAFMLLSGDDATTSEAPSQAVDLFTQTPATCPQTTADQALALANDKFDIAQGKRERSPFAPKDGVQAVELYKVASACFRVGGDPKDAEEADLAAEQLSTSLTQDFRARRVRLEHTLAAGDLELARHDVQVLRSLTEGKSGAYVQWLQQQNTMLKQKTKP